MSDEYNGWPSWQHWNVALWLYNDHPTYSVCMESIMNHPKLWDAARNINAQLVKKTPDGARYTPENIARAIEEDHKEYWEIFEDE